MKTNLEVGALLRGTVRRQLELAIFYGQLESYREVKGFLSSDFLLTNPSQLLIEQIKVWSKPDEWIDT